MNEPITGFDAVALQHEGAERIYEITKDMTLEQELNYWQERAAIVLQEQQGKQVASLAHHSEELADHK